MKRPTRPVQVEHKTRRAVPGTTAAPTARQAPTAVRRATPDRGRIQGWNADDVERQQEEAFLRRPTREQLEEAITAWCAMYRRPNDPDTEKRVAWREVGTDLVLAAMRNLRVIENKKGEEVAIIYPQKGGWGQLLQGLHMVVPPEKFIVTERSAPQPWKKTSWWQYVKDLRKRTK